MQGDVFWMILVLFESEEHRMYSSLMINNKNIKNQH